VASYNDLMTRHSDGQSPRLFTLRDVRPKWTLDLTHQRDLYDSGQTALGDSQALGKVDGFIHETKKVGNAVEKRF
jgi:hypothetical protein